VFVATYSRARPAAIRQGERLRKVRAAAAASLPRYYVRCVVVPVAVEKEEEATRERARRGICRCYLLPGHGRELWRTTSFSSRSCSWETPAWARPVWYDDLLRWVPVMYPRDRLSSRLVTETRSSHGDVTDAFANSCTSSRADARVSRKDRKLVIHASCAGDVIYVYVEFRTSLVFVSPYIAASASKHIARYIEALVNVS